MAAADRSRRGAHFYRSLLLDGHGNQINKRNAWAARSVAYVRLIPPGAADTIHYRLQIPKDAGNRIFLKAKVNYRKFAWWNTQWAFAGVRDPKQPEYSVGKDHDDGRWTFTGSTAGVSGPMKQIPDIPTTVMAESTASIAVIDAGAAAPPAAPFLDPSVRERWNDYGIGLLLQGDLKGAEAAFEKVTKMDPGYADGWVNIGRARLQEGNLEGAEDVLNRALAIDPEARQDAFLPRRPAEERRAVRRGAAASAHRFRALPAGSRRVQSARTRPLSQASVRRRPSKNFEKVLLIDPEDLQAHYNLMLCYQGMGDHDRAGRERQLYERFKADESSQAITGPYRQMHPDDNNERQAIHEHGVASPTRYGPTPAPAQREPN